MSKNKSDNLFWAKDTGKKVIKTAGKGIKVVVLATVAGLALGLGISAYGAGSSS